MGGQMERLVKYRRACRRYLKKNVDPEILDHILSAMQTVPAGAMLEDPRSRVKAGRTGMELLTE